MDNQINNENNIQNEEAVITQIQDDTVTNIPTAPVAPVKKSNAGLIIAIIVIVVLFLGGCLFAVALLFLGKKESSSNSLETTTTSIIEGDDENYDDTYDRLYMDINHASFSEYDYTEYSLLKYYDRKGNYKHDTCDGLEITLGKAYMYNEYDEETTEELPGYIKVTFTYNGKKIIADVFKEESETYNFIVITKDGKYNGLVVINREHQAVDQNGLIFFDETGEYNGLGFGDSDTEVYYDSYELTEEGLFVKYTDGNKTNTIDLNGLPTIERNF